MELHHYESDRREEEYGFRKKKAFKPVLIFKERRFRNIHAKSASFLLTLRFYFLHIRLNNLFISGDQ